MADWQSCPLFSGLGSADLARVDSFTREMSLPKGATLFARGDESSAFYLLGAGRIRLIPSVRGSLSATGSASASGSPDAAASPGARVIGPGTAFGEIGVLNSTPRIVSAEALEECRLFYLEGTAFDGLLASDPALAMKISDAFYKRYADRLGLPQWP